MAEPLAPLGHADDNPRPPKANVLMVDDLPANLLALRAALEELGQNLVEARSGEEALRLLKLADFAVVLLDVQMPGQDGFETAKQIRAAEAPHTPIIFLTAYDDGRFPAERAYTLGAVDYLVKPLVPVILRAKVTGFVELYQKTQQVKRQAERLRLAERRQFDERLAQENALLQESEERFRTLASHAPVGIIETDARGNCLFVNERWCQLAGMSPREAEGQGWARALHPEDRERVLSEWAAAARAGKEFASQYRFQTPQGKASWLQSSAVALRDGAGEAIGYLCTVTDVTERKHLEDELRLRAEQLQESEQRFSRFMQHLPGLAWIKDLQGRYLYANDAAVKAFRTTSEALYGKSDEEVFPPETARQFRENDREACASGAGVQVIETLEHEDGTLHHSIVSKFPIVGPDGGPALVGGMAIDITSRMKAEEALREADRLKDEFLAMLAHELRNPLAPIRNALYIMRQPNADAAMLRQARDMAERQVRHMARLLDDLLDVSRISRGRIELRKEPVDVAAVIGRTVEAARGLFEERRHELTVSMPAGPLRVEADPARLEQVLTNLLNNAAKYTGTGGRVRLVAERDGGSAVLRVRDTGIGIAPEMLTRIFDLFVQAERLPDSPQGGVGIGLTLVKRLVELHGGCVEAHSAGRGEGSEFVVRLPALADQPRDEQERAGEEAAAELPRCRVLVVDDNEDAADSLAMMLGLAGQTVRVAYDGPAALAQARQFRPELVFLDIGMPGMDGYEVARRLRDEAGLGGAVLVAVTGWGQEEDRHRSAAAGFNHHLVKPVEPKALDGLLAGMSGTEIG